MGGGRTRRRLTGWLALFALALQLGLAFGHSHAEDFARPGLALANGAAPASGSGDNRDTGHLDCAVCAVVHLAGALLAPIPPALETPTSFTAARLAAASPHAHAPSHAAAFRARAPPHA